ECFTPFVNGSFFEHDGQPYCEVHYHARRGNPSRAAASQPWARSFILSIFSSTRAPSKSKTTSLTARAASSSSSARKMPD
ncbi:hypothetical protein M9458_019009, partial [Cirrhinus mrigala]